ncbi:helix-turn-helix transcriptional regulator [Streptomyces smyrnaeus]|uniref:DNA-binding protein n=1 Tax=Streptomyces smyrnaeus TaxID=1387713 RepID=A0ABS3XR25_9ACTN|nr:MULTISPECIES: helix-turn-helix transcriptional regulator [Streptomyces]MBO8197511.1 DNA-binding protein [Streptomyces smyrnaeus]MBQ0864430.1 DNA-binding protein [Streptomyces sp. RK75]MBQ1118771.1 DNA-binding protein [Streptomyces sp. B15]MBQ1156992.1 DNA-binding protein [Streptomyces sp. A73]
MDAAAQDPTAKARELQSQWYGEPLGTLFRRLIEDLGLNQARLATVLGLSAPMLSQLMSGQRAKIGNPAVVQRVQALQELAAEVARGDVSAADATNRMDEIRRTAGGSVLNNTAQTSSSGASQTPVKRVVREIQALLRSVSDAADIIEASNALAPSHPELAEFLRVYGAGRTADAVKHYEAHQS